MSSLYELDKEYELALNNFKVDEETGEVLFDNELLEQLEGDYKQKVDNIACYIKDLQALSQSIKNEKANLDERLKANDKKIDSLKNYLFVSLERREISKLETARNKLSFRKSTSLIVEDEKLVPKKFINKVVTEKIDKNRGKFIMKRMKRFLAAYLCFGMMLFATVNASAYIDPSQVTLVIQVISGIVIALGATFYVVWRKIKKKASKVLGIDENAGKEVEEDIVIDEEETKTEEKDSSDKTEENK